MEYEVIKPVKKRGSRGFNIPSVTIQHNGIYILKVVQDHMRIGTEKHIRFEIAKLKSGPHRGKIAFRKVKEDGDQYHLGSRYRNGQDYSPYVIHSSIVTEVIRKDMEKANGKQKSKSTRVEVILGDDEWDWIIITNKISKKYANS